MKISYARKVFLAALLASISLPAAGQVTNQHRGDALTAEDGTKAVTAQGFAWKAANAGMKETELSQLALSKSDNSKIREFAKLMIDDHQKANSQLRDIADRQGLKLPSGSWASRTNAAGGDEAIVQGAEHDRDRTHATEPGKSYAQGTATDDSNTNRFKHSHASNDAKTLQTLQAASGTEFDHLYAQTMIEDHIKAVALFTAASQSLPDSDLQRFAAATLPTLRMHQHRAADLMPDTTNR
ncbi:MAG TPA: DUF4142 domain-containing protein [Verrucomicrobiae bacterium]